MQSPTHRRDPQCAPQRRPRLPLFTLALWASCAGAAPEAARGAPAAPGPAASGSPDAADLATLERGWAALRAMDCARCHGRDYGGWSGPSLLAAVRDGSRERFDRYVLDGDPVRGMPGYLSQPLVVAELDAIHAYLRARSEGRIGSGRPASGASR